MMRAFQKTQTKTAIRSAGNYYKLHCLCSPMLQFCARNSSDIPCKILALTRTQKADPAVQASGPGDSQGPGLQGRGLEEEEDGRAGPGKAGTPRRSTWVGSATSWWAGPSSSTPAWPALLRAGGTAWAWIVSLLVWCARIPAARMKYYRGIK